MDTQSYLHLKIIQQNPLKIKISRGFWRSVKDSNLLRHKCKIRSSLKVQIRGISYCYWPLHMRRLPPLKYLCSFDCLPLILKCRMKILE